jgi:hypothetical protein
VVFRAYEWVTQYNRLLENWRKLNIKMLYRAIKMAGYIMLHSLKICGPLIAMINDSYYLSFISSFCFSYILLWYNSTYNKMTLLGCTIQWFFSIFTRSCTHHHYLILQNILEATLHPPSPWSTFCLYGTTCARHFIQMGVM